MELFKKTSQQFRLGLAPPPGWLQLSLCRSQGGWWASPDLAKSNPWRLAWHSGVGKGETKEGAMSIVVPVVEIFETLSTCHFAHDSAAITLIHLQSSHDHDV